MTIEKLHASFQRMIHRVYPRSSVDVVFVPHTDPSRGDLWTDVAFRLSEENKVPLDGVSEAIPQQIEPPEGVVVSADRGYINIALKSGPDPAVASQWAGESVTIVGIPFVHGLSGDGYIRAQSRVLAQALFALSTGKSITWIIPGTKAHPETVIPGNLEWVDHTWAQIRADGQAGSPREAASSWSRGLHDLYISSGDSLSKEMTTIWLVPSVLDQGLVTQLKVRMKSKRNIALPMFSLRQLGEWGATTVSTENGIQGRALLLYLASSLTAGDVDPLTVSRNERANALWYLAMTRDRVAQWKAATAGHAVVPGTEGEVVSELHRRLGWLPVHAHRASMCGAVEDFLLYLDETLALIHKELNSPLVRATWERGIISEDQRQILWLADEFLCDRMWTNIFDT